MFPQIYKALIIKANVPLCSSCQSTCFPSWGQRLSQLRFGRVRGSCRWMLELDWNSLRAIDCMHLLVESSRTSLISCTLNSTQLDNSKTSSRSRCSLSLCSHIEVSPIIQIGSHIDRNGRVISRTQLSSKAFHKCSSMDTLPYEWSRNAIIFDKSLRMMFERLNSKNLHLTYKSFGIRDGSFMYWSFNKMYTLSKNFAFSYSNSMSSFAFHASYFCFFMLSIYSFHNAPCLCSSS